MIAFDTTEASALAASPKAQAIREGNAVVNRAKTAPVAPPVETQVHSEAIRPYANAGMIFLRRDDRGWWVRYFGIVSLGANELPLPGDRSAKVADLLSYLKVQHGNKLSGAWILIAP